MSGLKGCFWLKVSYAVSVKVLAVTVSSEGLTGLKDPLVRWLCHVAVKEVSVLH